jgi:hypothetical protein
LPPGIIFPIEAYDLFSGFLPFVEHVSPELAGASKLKGSLAGVPELGAISGGECGPADFSGVGLAAVNPGAKVLAAGGGGSVSERGVRLGVSIAGDCVVTSVPVDVVSLAALLSVVGVVGTSTGLTVHGTLSSLFPEMPEPNNSGIFSGTRLRTVNGVGFRVSNTSALQSSKSR